MESFCKLFETEEEDRIIKSKCCSDSENEGNDKSDSNNIKYDDRKNRLPPEPEQGNIEYKLKLINPSSQRFEHLVTQMKWRLQEGNGEAIYQIGVEDNGNLAGLSNEDMVASLNTLRDMATRLGATTILLKERSTESKCVKKNSKKKTSKKEGKKVAEVLIRKLRKDDREENLVSLRLAVMGGQDAGKSTLLGVLTQGELDNGRGRSRLNMLRHLHEIKSGRTSSISHEIIGFDNEGQILNYVHKTTAEEICEHATKIITFIDLAGHRKYLRTTLLGLMGYSPHYVMLVVAPPVNEIVQEHMTLCLDLCLPFFVVVTKVDLSFCDPLEIIYHLTNIARLQNCNKSFVFYNSCNDKVQDNDILVFPVSCVTGEGLDELTKFIRSLSQTELASADSNPDSCLFQIDEIFRIVGSSEPILGGLLVKGVISLGMRLLVGPSPNGEFNPAKVISLHRNKAPCCVVRASQSASLTLAPTTKRDPPLPNLRPGMVLVAVRDHPYATLFFQATLIVLYHATAISPGFQATLYIGNVRQTCVIEGIMDIKKRGLKTNDTGSVLFRFLSYPEYLHVEMRLLLREGRTKAIGKVTQIFPLAN